MINWFHSFDLEVRQYIMTGVHGGAKLLTSSSKNKVKNIETGSTTLFEGMPPIT
jgi:hypothetical protein